ncbi:MAG: DNA ligase [Variovorax sp.]
MIHASHLIDRRSLLVAAVAGLALAAPRSWAASSPSLMLARNYKPGSIAGDQMAGYFLSEKYDGVRAFWDGKTLVYRSGDPIVAPRWFTDGLPPQPLDGELWVGRGRFADTVSTVRSQSPKDQAWRQLNYMVFDMPVEKGDFTQRLSVLRKLLPLPDAPWAIQVAQQLATTPEALQAQLDETLKLGGEGLMLHRGASLYTARRSADLQKFKPFDDAEARVVAQLEGKGQLAGRMGALLVETPEGMRFKLGSGFSDADRSAPPPIGSWVTYRYNGETAAGVPRFARFMRLSPDAPHL